MLERRHLLIGYARARHLWRFTTRTQLEAHQQRQFMRFRQNVLTRSPYYLSYTSSPLEMIPIMTKPEMLEHFGAINTAGISGTDAMGLAETAERSRDFTPRIGCISVGLSTGTSGTRGVFLVSEAERMTWAGIMLGRMLRGSLLAPHRIAFFLRANNNLYESVSGRLRIAFRFFDLMKPLEQHFAGLQAWQPTILIAPAQVLRLLAAMQAAAAPPLAPAQVISVGEVLYEDDRALIAAAFRRPVEQVYQATEGFLGYTCHAGKLHLNEAFLHIEPEWLDDARTRFSPLVTDFSRTTQPIVRMRLGDVLTPDPAACPCGSAERVIARIEGRTDDILVLTGADGTRVQIMPDYVSRALAGAGGTIRDFRVTQTKAGLTVLLAASDTGAARHAAAAHLQAMAQAFAMPLPPLKFGPLPDTGLMVKRRRVVRDPEVAL